MTTAEKIAFRWLSAFSAGLGGVSTVLLAADDIVSRGVIIGVTAVGAMLAGMVAFLTTESGQEKLGLRKMTTRRGK